MKRLFAAAALAAIILTSGTANAYESRGNQCGELAAKLLVESAT